MTVRSSQLERFVLVTGATGGVGQLLIDRLASDGFGVLAAARDPSALAGGHAGQGRIIPVPLDLTSPAAIGEAAEHVAHLTGESGLQGLINAAGIIVEGPLEVISPNDFSRQFIVNVFGPFALTQALLPLLRTAKGRVVNIGAATARTTVPFFGAISASKAALASISDAMRMEFAPFGIQVALIEPGALKTAIFDRSASGLKATLARNPEKACFYGPAIEAMQRANRKAASNSPVVVVDAVMSALSSKRVKPRRLVGRGSGLLRLLSRLPASVRDPMLMGSLGIAKAMTASLAEHPGGPVAAGVHRI